jgi:hypothetical protein
MGSIWSGRSFASAKHGCGGGGAQRRMGFASEASPNAGAPAPNGVGSRPFLGLRGCGGVASIRLITSSRRRAVSSSLELVRDSSFMPSDSTSEHEVRYRDFYMLVGACIKRWAHVEEVVFNVCHWALNTDDRLVAVVFSRTPSLDAQLTLSLDLLEARLLAKPLQSGSHIPPKLKQWRTLLRAVRELVPIRNFIVHHPTTQVMEAVGITTNDPGRRAAILAASPPPKQYWAIRPSRSERLRLRTRKIEELRAEDLAAHYEQVTKLLPRLLQFQNSLQPEQREPPPQPSP